MHIKKQLPAGARRDQLKKQAKDLLSGMRAGAVDAHESGTLDRAEAILTQLSLLSTRKD